jgi:plasmid stability protein
MIKKKLASGLEIVVRPLSATKAAKLAIRMASHEEEAIEIVREVVLNGQVVDIDDIAITTVELLELVKEATEMNFGKQLEQGNLQTSPA